MFHFRKYTRAIGPGVVTGASDDDPSGIVTYTQAGAQYGNSFLWLALVTTPLMFAVQEMSARLGLVTGRGLASLARQYISPPIALLISGLLLVANIVNIGADLGAMAEVTRLFWNIPAPVIVLALAVSIVVLEIFVSYQRYVNILKWLTLSLFAYVAVIFFVQIDWGNVLTNFFIPTIPAGPGVWAIIVAILGTTISPYLFFWQASEESEVTNLPGEKTDVAGRLQAMRRDTKAGMILSNLIMLVIMMAAAATLHQSGIIHVTSAGQAAEALRPLAGQWTFLLFSLGMLGTGLLAIPVLAGSAAYAMAEVVGRPEGLGKKFSEARFFYVCIILAVTVGVGLTLLNISPFTMLLTAATFNGLLAPVMLYIILRLADRPEVVGGHISSPTIRRLGWLTFGAMTVAGLMLLGQVLL